MSFDHCPCICYFLPAGEESFALPASAGAGSGFYVCLAAGELASGWSRSSLLRCPSFPRSRSRSRRLRSRRSATTRKPFSTRSLRSTISSSRHRCIQRCDVPARPDRGGDRDQPAAPRSRPQLVQGRTEEPGGAGRRPGENGEQDVIEVMLGASSLGNLLDRLDLVDRISDQDVDMIDSVSRSREEIKQREKEPRTGKRRAAAGRCRPGCPAGRDRGAARRA